MKKLLSLLLCFEFIFAESFDEDKIDLSHFGIGIYGEPIPSNGMSRVRQFGNPEESGPYLEGDLLIPVDGKNGIKLESARWKNGEIPYEIRKGFGEFWKLNLCVSYKISSKKRSK